MHGLMMDRPLRIIDILTFAAEVHRDGAIVSARTEGDIHRESYSEVLGRVGQLAHALDALGIEEGDRIATLAWNGHRHVELYYAISGIGAICHTINPRLSLREMIYIIRHAKDRIIFADITFLPLLEKLAPELPHGLVIVAMTDRDHLPDNAGDLLVYEDLLAPHPATYDFPHLPETTASGLCYTSGTTGEPKGALYTHRSTVLHALFVNTSVPTIMQERRTILPVVPLFHVNAWGLPYSAPLAGASLVMPGPKLDGASLFDLMDAERVSSAWGVPTVWFGLLAEIDKRGRIPEGFDSVCIGGSAAPAPMIARFEEWGVEVCHAWGMTEMSPIGTQGLLPMAFDDAPEEERLALKARQGRRIFGVELKIVGEDGTPLPHDGVAQGELCVRGPTIISAYFENEAATKAAFDAEGWFKTGDVATLDERGFLGITDRAKDLIKSGGEWISSIDLESAALAHPKIANCAVIAVPDERWGERPLLVVVPKGDARPQKDDVLKLLAARFARWQLPDDVVFVETLPLTATGKVSKRTLRDQFTDRALPAAERAAPSS